MAINAKDVISIDCDIQNETAAAMLIKAHDVNGEIVKVWIPLSQTHEIHRKESVSAGLFTDRVVISKWIAIKKELA